MADVLAELHAVETDVLDGIVRAAARHLHRVAERGDAQHTPAVGKHALTLEPRPGVEHSAVVGRPRQAFDAIALARPSDDCRVFHAGTRLEGQSVLTNGG